MDKRRIKALETELSLAKKEKQNAIGNMETAVSELRRDLEHISNEHIKCKRRIKVLEDELSVTKKEKEKALQNREEAVSNVRRTLQDVKIELDDYKRKNKVLEKELSVRKKEKEAIGNIKDKAQDLALSKNLKELFQSGYKSDVTVKVEEKEFLVHKALLAARSSVFRTMFETDMVEKKDGVVNIEDCEPAHFENFLLFMYSGQFDIVSSCNALKLCLIADKYNVVQLKDECFQVMKKEMSIESICDAVFLASLYNKQDLLDVATKYFAENTYKVICTAKWLSFLTEHAAIANELLIKSMEKTKQ